MISLVGAIIGALVAPVIWAIIPPDEPTADAEKPATDQSPSVKPKVLLTFQTTGASIVGGKEGKDEILEVQVHNVEIVNRDSRDMSLKLSLAFKCPRLDGGIEQFIWGSSSVQWKDGYDDPTGIGIVNLKHESTVAGMIVLRLRAWMWPKEVDWRKVNSKHITVLIHDVVSGAHMAFLVDDAFGVYPPKK
jgi:hypothetical protein